MDSPPNWVYLFDFSRVVLLGFYSTFLKKGVFTALPAMFLLQKRPGKDSQASNRWKNKHFRKTYSQNLFAKPIWPNVVAHFRNPASIISQTRGGTQVLNPGSTIPQTREPSEEKKDLHFPCRNCPATGAGGTPPEFTRGAE